MSDKTREAFEAWWQAPIDGMDARKNDMFECPTDDAFQIWQACRLAALAEIKQALADLDDAYETGVDPSCGMGFSDAIEAVTNLIDSLANPADNRPEAQKE